MITSLTAILGGFSGPEINYIIIFSTVMSSLPDIDIRLELPHRKYTHNIFFGILAGLAAGIVSQSLGFSFVIGFASVFIGVLTHILGDLMTYMPFSPLAPLINKKISFRLFKSSNTAVNFSFLLLGAFTYYLFLTSKSTRINFTLLP